MLPEIPTLNAQQRYLLKGRFYDLFRDRILRIVPIAGRGIDVTEECFGMRISLSDAATGTSALDFASSLAGSSVAVRAGKVLHTDWTGFDANDPQCAEWAAEAFTVAADTLTLADGESVFLKLTIAATTIDSIGALSSTGSGVVSVTGGGGGIGEDGEQGKAVQIYNYAKAKIKIRRWRATAGEFVTDTAQPTGSETTAYIRICERDGSSLIQHQIGCITLNLPVVSFVSST